MRIDRFLPAHGPDQRKLAKGIVEMIVAADHMRDAHVMIVDNNRQHIGGRPVRAEQDEIVEFRVVHGHRALDAIFDRHAAFLRGLQPDDEWRTFRCFGRVAIAPAPVVAHGLLRRALRLAHRLQLCRGRVAAIGVSAVEQLIGDFRMAFGAGELEDGIAVPVEPEPLQAVEDRVNRCIRRARAIRIFDAQEEFSAVMPCKQPVEQGRTRAADMQETRWRRGKTRDNA